MNSVTLYRKDHFVQFCNKCLQDVVNEVRGVEAALIATPDGFSITHHDRLGKFNADKLSAVSSSVFALSASLVTEFNMQNCHSILIDSKTGSIFVTAIEAQNHHLILLIEASEEAMLAAIMHASKTLKQKISKSIDEGILEQS